MAAWVWLVALVVGMALLQLLVYRRLREEPDRESPTGDASDRATLGVYPDLEHNRTDSTPEGVRRCPHCGTENDADPVYTFCAACLRRLQ